jgi:hypothetical protein
MRRFALEVHCIPRRFCDAKDIYSLRAAELLGPSLRILWKRDAMSVVWKSTCGSCGERHTFHFRDAELLPQNQAYEYNCPRTAEVLLYADNDCEWPQVDAVKPADAVDLRIRLAANEECPVK